MPITEVKYGNLLTSGEKYIGHGVNCRGVMGSGIALQIKERWPNTNARYKDYCKTLNWSIDLLGDCMTTEEDGLVIWNMFTQFDTSRHRERNASYDAIADCFATLEQQKLERFAIPLIGAGLGGGNWYVIKEIINHYAPTTPIVVYELK